ncbi:peptide/nickel transport system ATP-binding protein [Kribbella sp. VKM Ac-2527]|uniref:Peptide/nickel transport system ATP-binding protein n=1 Tax=Kribbella caucasensis TaxID=2512215 RepID=A0A4R6KFM9_9ACTN|nr:ABC transporter ATP-binding protein [Kribbella sp. VKM Ac-2527]TDO48060.1 peptide/nickel transport system ATP-binding protein [Kribbella sp. VKM Ac-2527]
MSNPTVVATAARPDSGRALLRVRNLRTEFKVGQGRVQAVNDVSFDIHPGDVLGIVGESGSGKSVTARSIMRMVRAPGEIVGGSVEFGGEDLLLLPEREMRRRRGSGVAMVFQDPQAALNPVMTIGDQIIEALTLHGTEKRTARGRALELLDQVGIPDSGVKIDQYPHQFSGGMRQRVVIAIALANDPVLLIADEPTTALDVTIQAQILRLLLRLREELGLAIAIITHDMGVVAEMCSRVAVMYGGRVVEQGTVEQVLRTPRHPYTAALLAAMPRLDDERLGQPLPAIPGSPPDPSALPPGCSFAPRCRFAEDGCRHEVPALLQVGDEDQLSACFVAQRGVAVNVTPAFDPVAVDPVAAEPVPVEDVLVEHRTAVDTDTVLEVRDLRVDVGSRRRGLFHRDPPVYAVDSVSLAVHAGETVGLVGESGCGKSTLSRSIVGITPVAGGSVEVDGEDVTSMGDEQVARIRSSVQYVFQDPYASLNPRRTVRQSLAEALSLRGLRGAELEAESHALMDRVGLRREYLDRYPHAFSGGQRQRIGIARALARRPKVLILDEPVSALDMSIQAQIINLLEELQRELGLGYLFIAHDLSVVRHLSDRVAVMYLGRIVETGTAAEVYGDPQHPYTVALLSSSPTPTVEERTREQIVLQGDLPSPANPPSGCRFRTRCPIGPLVHPERTICAEQDPELLPRHNHQAAACHFPGELL